MSSTARKMKNAALVIFFIACVLANNSFSADGDALPMHKGTLKTIYSGNGEIVDCVDFYQQPAFDHPLLKDYKIEIPEFIREKMEQNESSEPKISQVWTQYGECPEGTVPILRSPEVDNALLRKMKRLPGRRGAERANPDAWLPGIHEYALVETKYGKYFGSRATFTIWKPFVEKDYEFSLAQTWVSARKGRSLETIEAGWQVFPALYDKSHDVKLFTYWTADNYKDTGCYNMKCIGFVLLPGKWTPGASMKPSQIDGEQLIMDIHIYKDQMSGNWWLLIGDHVIGHWPSKLFEKLSDSADLVQWGGEVVNYNHDGRHTSTQMGSGRFPFEGNKKAAYVRTLQVVTSPNGPLVDPDHVNTDVTDAGCYDLKINPPGTFLGQSFYYGGTGRTDSTLKCI